MKQIPDHARKVFGGVIYEIWQWDQKMFDGSTAVFECAKRIDAVTVLPITSDNRILITEQLQPNWVEPLFCLPGGMCDVGGTAEEEAQRELLEETGYQSDDWSLWKTYDAPGKVEWTITTFVARNCKKVQDISPDSGEQISVRAISLDEFLNLALLPNFRHRDIQVELIQAKYVPERRKDLEQKLFG